MAKWYYIVTTADSIELCVAVNEMIDEGFEPIGGAFQDNDGSYNQTLAKEYDPSRSSAALEYDKYVEHLHEDELEED